MNAILFTLLTQFNNFVLTPEKQMHAFPAFGMHFYDSTFQMIQYFSTYIVLCARDNQTLFV